MLFKRHFTEFCYQDWQKLQQRERERATNKNTSIRQSCSGVMSAFCEPFRVFLVQAWQCSCVNRKQIWVLLHTHVQCRATATKGCWCGDTDSSSVNLGAGAEFCTWVLPTHLKMSLTKVSQKRRLGRVIPCVPQKSSAIMGSIGTSTGQRAPERGWLCKSSHLKGRGQSLLLGCFKHHKKTQLKSREQEYSFSYVILVIDTQFIISISIFNFSNLHAVILGFPGTKI